MNLSGRTALVTGGAVRIGRAICEALALAGCNVVVHYNKSGAEAKTLVHDIIRDGVKAYAVRGDLGSSKQCVRIVSDAWRMAGGLDILVNNAAVFHKDTIMNATSDKMEAELAVNLLAPMMLSREFARRFRKAGQRAGGRIINLLDRRIAFDDPECVPYLLSKKMLAEFTKAAAVEFAPAITVNGVAPGAVLPPAGKGNKRVRDMAGRILLQRRPEPEDVANAVVYLAGAGAITGQVLFVDGGQHLEGGV
jgi:pteridine reductase